MHSVHFVANSQRNTLKGGRRWGGGGGSVVSKATQSSVFNMGVENNNFVQ